MIDEADKKYLTHLLDDMRRHAPGSPEYQSTVSTYREVLDSVIERGLDEPLPDELLPDPWLFSERYADFEQRWHEDHPLTFGRFVADYCASIYRVRVEGVGASRASAEVFTTFKGERRGRIDFNHYAPWGFREWYSEGEEAFLFLDSGGTSLGQLGRMPVGESFGDRVAISYAPDRRFWPLREVVPGETGEGRRVFLIPVVSLERLIIQCGAGGIAAGGNSQPVSA